MAAPVTIRQRAVAKVLAGGSKAAAAREAKVSVNTITRWVEDAERSAQQTAMLERTQMITETVQETDPIVEETARRPKRTRTPLGKRNVLTYAGDNDPRYIHRIVVEDDRRLGRVEQFKAAGWEPVRGDKQLGDDYVDNAGVPGSVVGKPVGMGATGYLMRKLRDEESEDLCYVAEDAKAKEEKIFTDLKDPNKPNQFGSLSVGSRREERR